MNNNDIVHMQSLTTPELAACGTLYVEILPIIEFEGLMAGAPKACCPECVRAYAIYTTAFLDEIDAEIKKSE